MNAPSGQLSTLPLAALLQDGTLAGDWVLDSDRSSVRLKSKVMGLIPVSGVFREVAGRGTVQPDGAVSGTLTVAAASIDTRNARRDKHLRSADFFDTGHHRDLTFTADGLRASGQQVTVTGALSIRGQVRPLSVQAEAAVRGDGEVTLTASLRINRADFGLTWNVLGLTAMLAVVSIHATFTRR